MSYNVRTLTPDMAETFADYLANLDFSHAPSFAGCFCRFYHTDCSEREYMEKSGENNRKEAVESIRNGTMQGYLAFDREKCIGWLNANSLEAYLRVKNDLIPHTEGMKAGLVICFVIHPEYRGKGVASLLLEDALEGFRKKGYEMVLGLSTQDKDIPTVLQYSGPYPMFLKQGFEEIGSLGNRKILRKML